MLVFQVLMLVYSPCFIHEHLGKLVPGLKWLNRVEIRVEDKKVASSYVPKKTGPTFNELLSIIHLISPSFMKAQV